MFVSSLGLSVAHCMPNSKPLKLKHGKCNKMVGDSHSGGFRPPQTIVPVNRRGGLGYRHKGRACIILKVLRRLSDRSCKNGQPSESR